MPGLLSDVLASLSRSREAVLPSAEVFPLVDLDQLAESLRLDVRGQEDGRSNLPASADLETSTESDIRAEIERRASKAHSDYRTQLDLYDGRIRRALISVDLRTSIEAAGERALSDFRAQATDDLSQLETIATEVRERHAEFMTFRSVHGLSRLPRPSRHVTLRRAFLGLLILVEALAARGTSAVSQQTPGSRHGAS